MNLLTRWHGRSLLDPRFVTAVSEHTFDCDSVVAVGHNVILVILVVLVSLVDVDDPSPLWPASSVVAAFSPLLWPTTSFISESSPLLWVVES